MFIFQDFFWDFVKGEEFGKVMEDGMFIFNFYIVYSLFVVVVFLNYNLLLLQLICIFVLVKNIIKYDVFNFFDR